MLVPTRFYDIRFKLGQWDGKIPFFYQNGNTYLNLLDQIIPYIEDVGYDIELVDKRKTKVCTPEPIDNQYLSHLTFPDGSPLILRDHQVKVINALIKNGGGIGKAATGAGKTFITGCLTKLYEETCGYAAITIVPNKTLVRQTHKDYIWMGLDAGVFYGDKKDTGTKHLVSTWQSLKNNPQMLSKYKAVIVDECHQAKGPILQKLLLKSGGNIPVRFGVTGTMPKEDIDKMTVNMALGYEQIEVAASELIQKGFLSDLDIEVFVLQHDLTSEYEQYKRTWKRSLTEKKPVTYIQYKSSFLPDYASEKSFNNGCSAHMSWIAQKMQQMCLAHGNVLCLVDSVAYGRKLAGMTENAIFLSGKDKVADREAIYAQYAERDDIILIATAQIASTGLNIKRIFTLMYINFGKSGIKTIQSIGRGLRMDVDKNKVKVIDITNDLKYSKRHTNERLKFYDEANYPYVKKTVKFHSIDDDIFD